MKRFLLTLLLVLTPIMARATVPEVVNARQDYTGNAVTTVFAYTFKIFNKADLRVLVGGVVKTVDVDYSVSGVNADAGGSITFTTAPATGASVVILRDQPIDQVSAYQAGGGFPANRVERDLDRNIMVDQMQQEQINRALRYPESYNPSVPGQTILPIPVPGKCIGWNSSGIVAANDCSGGGGGTIAGIQIDGAGLSLGGLLNFQDTASIDFTNPSGANVQAAIKTGGVGTTAIADDAVTYAKIQNISAASRLLGRGSAAGAGDTQEISLGTGLSMSGTALGVSLDFSQLTGAPTDAQIPDLNTLSTGLTANRCVETGPTGLLTVTGSACGSSGSTGDIDGVLAGVGLAGGGNAGTVTLVWDPSTFTSNIVLWDGSQATRTLTANLSGTDPVITFGSNAITVTQGALTAGAGGSITATAFSDPGMTALAAFNTNGFIAQTSDNNYAGRTLTAVSNETVITNGDGVSGNPLIGLASTISLASKTAVTPWPVGTTLPATCVQGQAWFDSDAAVGSKLVLCDTTNTWATIAGSGGGSGSGHAIQEEGTPLTARASLNFIGAALTAADDSGNNATTVTLSQSPASGSVVGTGRTITTNSPLGGGGNLTADLTLTCTTCATASGAASGQVGYFTSGTALTSSANFGFDGTDVTLGNVATNYQRIVSASLTAPRTVTLPDADSVTVVPTTATSNQFLTNITTGGVQTKAQPAFTNISGTAAVSQGGTGLTTVAANRLLGTGGSVDAVQAITIGSNLTLAAGVLSASGGTGSPGGSTTQIQYNSSGSFAGHADLVFDDANSHMSVGALVIDPDNTPRLWFDHDGTWGIVSTAGSGSGAGNIGLKLSTEGTGRVRVSSLATTGAATGKTVVCADANGDLYRSSTGTDCSN